MQSDRCDDEEVALLLACNQEAVLLRHEVETRQSRFLPPEALSFTLAITGPLEVSVLMDALTVVATRNPGLRSQVFPNPCVSPRDRSYSIDFFAKTTLFQSGLFLQTISADAHVDLRSIDLGASEGSDLDAALVALRSDEETFPFAGGRPPHMRALLGRQQNNKHVLVVTLHHLCADNWSLDLVRSQIHQSYRALSGDGPALPACRSLSYHEFAALQHERMRTGHFSRSREYWRRIWEKFGPERISRYHLPFCLMTSDSLPGEPGNAGVRVGEGDFVRIRAFARQKRVTLHAFFLASLGILLHHYTGKEYLPIWHNFANRLDDNTAETVGFLVNHHIVGLRVAGTMSGVEVLCMAQQALMEASEHQEMPLMYLWRSYSCSPIYTDCGISLEVYDRADRGLFELSTSKTLVTSENVADGAGRRGTSKLKIRVDRHESHLAVICNYPPATFVPEGVCQMINSLVAVALGVVSGPERPISQFASVAPSARARGDSAAKEMAEFATWGRDGFPSFSAGVETKS